jgi:hypothetical protein|uniref:Uncharacterized protein n=1 Tax=viral metagenome TaxID=1070528 RepID=A0A6C0CKB8_9ZZZZ
MSDDNEDKNDSTYGSEDNNWSGFLKSVLRAFITVLIIGFLGANFVYLTRIDLDLWFPVESSLSPYEEKPTLEEKAEFFNRLPKGGGCGIPIDTTKSKLWSNKYFRGMFDHGWPYTLAEDDDDEEWLSFGEIVSFWFMRAVKYSYIWLRTVIQTVISFSSSFCELMPEQGKDIIPFIIGPFVLMLLISIASMWYIPSLISIFVYSTGGWNLAWSIVGLFFGWTWIVPLFTSFAQSIGLMFKLLLLPIMLDSKKLIEIMGHKWNIYFMGFVFFALCISAAFTNLNLTVAIVMSLIFALNFIPPSLNPMTKSNKVN